MSQKDAFEELRYSQEEKYFIQKEQELIGQLRRRAEIENEIENITHSKDVITDELLRDLQSLGYTRETLSLLYMIPLVYVAWSEGFVSDLERKRIFTIAHTRGIQDNSKAHKQLSTWLDEQPTEEFFGKSLGIIQTLLHSLPPDEEEKEKRELIAECHQVADISRNLWGYWGAIPRPEKEAINHIAEELEREHYSITKEQT